MGHVTVEQRVFVHVRNSMWSKHEKGKIRLLPFTWCPFSVVRVTITSGRSRNPIEIRDSYISIKRVRVGSVDWTVRPGGGHGYIFDIILSQRLNRCMPCMEHDSPPLKSEIQQLRIVRPGIIFSLLCLLKQFYKCWDLGIDLFTLEKHT